MHGCDHKRIDYTSRYRKRPPPIGCPIKNVQVFVLDRDGRPLPIGVPGELYIGGAGLARGYVNQPELTRQKFVTVPYVGQGKVRLYRSGDIVRWREDRQLDYLGRLDEQVKIRGYRIEPGRLKRQSALAGSSRSGCRSVSSPVGQLCLVAYVVGSNVQIEALREG